MPPQRERQERESEGQYNRMHDLDMTQRDWLEANGLPPENEGTARQSVNALIRQQELDEERRARAREKECFVIVPLFACGLCS